MHLTKADNNDYNYNNWSRVCDKLSTIFQQMWRSFWRSS